MNTRLFVIVVLASNPLRTGAQELRFERVLSLSGAGSPGPAVVAAGDLNADGKLDLVTANNSGEINVFLQDRLDRNSWQKQPSRRVGLPIYMVQTIDLNRDGYAEIFFGDASTSAYMIRNQDGVLDNKPIRVPSTDGARWITAGDWNKDGHLDIATANFSQNTTSVLLGDGTGALKNPAAYSLPEPHAVEPGDLDLDGDLDLFVGYGDMGLRTLDGNGDGTFAKPVLVPQKTTCGRYVFPADFNNDGRSDIVTTCMRSAPQGGAVGNVLVSINKGQGVFEPTLEVELSDIAIAAVGDFNGDLDCDLAHVSLSSTLVSVHPGRGDGSLDKLVNYGPAGQTPTYVIAADLDADGKQDLIVTDANSSTITILWGTGEEQMFQSAFLSSGHKGTTPAVADYDGDGATDFCFPSTSPVGVDLYTRPAFQSAAAPKLRIPTAAVYNSLRGADMNGDEVPDVLGVNTKQASLGVVFLSRDGGVLKQVSFPVGSFPGLLEVGRIDEGETLDVAVPCFGSNEVRLFFGRGGDTLEVGAVVPTFESPKFLVLGDVDSDGKLDMAMTTALGVVVVHFNTGGGAFGAAVPVYQSATPVTFLDFALGDVTGDSFPDLLLSIARMNDLLVVPSKGNREFEAPIPLTFKGRPRSISLADLDSDGTLDFCVSQLNHSFSFLYSRPNRLFEPALELNNILPSATDAELRDLNNDGLLDLAVYGGGISAVILGAPATVPPLNGFRRGDADLSGKVDLTDAVVVLQHLLGGKPSPCEKGSDVDDDGLLSLADALGIAQWLFQGAPMPGAPGPEVCGEDPTPDALKVCGASCR